MNVYLYKSLEGCFLLVHPGPVEMAAKALPEGLKFTVYNKIGKKLIRWQDKVLMELNLTTEGLIEL